MLELALILFVAACGLIGLAVYRQSARFSFQQRLERIKHDEVQTPEEELNRPFVQRIVLPLADSVARAAPHRRATDWPLLVLGRRGRPVDDYPERVAAPHGATPVDEGGLRDVWRGGRVCVAAVHPEPARAPAAG